MRPSQESRWRWWWPALVWAALIFAQSSVAFEPFPSAPGLLERTHLDKAVHLVLFGVLGWLCARALRHGHALRLPLVAVVAILLSSAYGASDEWHQSFVPGRYCDALDWLADTAGALLAAWLYLRTQRIRQGVASRVPTRRVTVDSEDGPAPEAP